MHTEVDRAWKLVETAKEKEEKARKIIQELKDEVQAKTTNPGTGSVAIVGSVNEKEAPKGEDAQEVQEAEEGGKTKTMYIVAGSVVVAAIGVAAFIFKK